jgi:hypothetical protein
MLLIADISAVLASLLLLTCLLLLAFLPLLVSL